MREPDNPKIREPSPRIRERENFHHMAPRIPESENLRMQASQNPWPCRIQEYENSRTRECENPGMEGSKQPKTQISKNPNTQESILRILQPEISRIRELENRELESPTLQKHPLKRAHSTLRASWSNVPAKWKDPWPVSNMAINNGRLEFDTLAAHRPQPCPKTFDGRKEQPGPPQTPAEFPCAERSW